ncbi:fasciclin domain-containing protein [Calothrix sp. NIES-3974]|uniref:fasciclin domain-containing protein n=1 Tax=Calothrix sp. NIES-3974 TaxID=2005462 RepID=UPI000B5E1D71|nr:fasciclin domain-containing protein [Calothrix sp. NIES-3974]BAZ05575.1 beta-Ig-H3/fasciclin [Calothrix sp. NIES-3974]
MKVNNSYLLTKLASIVGVTGVSLLASLSVGAQETLNPTPSIFSEAPYNRSQRVLSNSQYTPQPVVETNKKTKKTTVAQGTRGGINPSPSIFQECPYNRSACPGSGSTTSTPAERPAPQPLPAPVTPPPETPAPGAGAPSGTTEGKNIVAVAQANGSFNTLTKALKAAGLVETLQGNGPFTVFAPTDEAFAKLPPDALQELLQPQNKEVLKKILTYHVVSGRVLSTDLKSGEVKSIEGGPINVRVEGGAKVMVNDAQVVQPDVKASNGVIHVINQVILPPDL